VAAALGYFDVVHTTLFIASASDALAIMIILSYEVGQRFKV